MSSSSVNGSVASGELRERLPQNPEQPQQAQSTDEAQNTVRSLNQQEDGKDEKEKRTYGRTPNGTGSSNFMALASGRGAVNVAIMVATNGVSKCYTIHAVPVQSFPKLIATNLTHCSLHRSTYA